MPTDKQSNRQSVRTKIESYYTGSVRMLFIDYSSAFTTKLRTLGLNTSLCKWLLDFLMGHPLVVKVGNNTSAMLILKTGASQGCVLRPLLYSMFTHDCLAKHNTITIIKFADDTTVTDHRQL